MIADEPASAVLLRRLAFSEQATIEAVFAGEVADFDNSDFDDKGHALVRLAALVASDSAAAPSYQWAVSVALAEGVTRDEVVGVLVSVAPMVGVARIVSAAAMLAAALGYDLELLD